MKGAINNGEKRTCIICGAEFITRRLNQLTCSEECHKERNRRATKERARKLKKETWKPLPAVKCIVCGTEFTPRNNFQVYCCADCREEATRKNEREKRRLHRSHRPHIGRPIGTTLEVLKARKKSKHITMGEIMKMGYKDYAEYQKAQTLKMIKERAI